MKKNVFIYDDFSDRLFISSKGNSDKVYGSVRVLNLTIDFTQENKPVNVEIRRASKYLESIGINPRILNNLTNAEVVFQQKRDGYLIYFILYSGKRVERIPYNIITAEPALAPS
jgi:hypothetical protein